MASSQFVEQDTVGYVLSNCETQQNNVLRKCVAVFGEFRGVSRDGSTCQMYHLLSKPENLRLREGLNLVELNGKHVLSEDFNRVIYSGTKPIARC